MYINTIKQGSTCTVEYQGLLLKEEKKDLEESIKKNDSEISKVYFYRIYEIKGVNI